MQNNVFTRIYRKMLGWVDSSNAMTSGSDVEKIVNTVLDVTKVTHSEFLSKRRSSEYVRARHIAIYVLLETTDLSCVQIGNVVNRDHTTVIYVRNKMKKRGQGASRLNRDLAEVKRRLAA